MTATIQYPVTVTLEASTLLAHYCTLLARAALIRIHRAEVKAYWASDCGQAKLAAMHCGEQDTVSERLAAMTSEAESCESAASAIGAAISAAGYPLPVVVHHNLTRSDLLDHMIDSGAYLSEIRAELRHIVNDGRLPVRSTVFPR